MSSNTILRRPGVKERTGLSDTQLDRLESQGRFPSRIKITERAVGWSEQDVNAWIKKRLSGEAA